MTNMRDFKSSGFTNILRNESSWRFGLPTAELVMEETIIPELNGTMEAQLLSYLSLSKISVGCVVNFRDERV